MSKLLARIAGYLSNRNLVGVDKVGNRYFTRTEEIDGISKWVSPLPVVDLCLFFSLHLLLVCIFVDVSVKEKRCVIFKGEGDPTSISGTVLKFGKLPLSVAMLHSIMPYHNIVYQVSESLVFNEPFLINWFSLISGQVQA